MSRPGCVHWVSTTAPRNPWRPPGPNIALITSRTLSVFGESAPPLLEKTGLPVSLSRNLPLRHHTPSRSSVPWGAVPCICADPSHTGAGSVPCWTKGALRGAPSYTPRAPPGPWTGAPQLLTHRICDAKHCQVRVGWGVRGRVRWAREGGSHAVLATASERRCHVVTSSSSLKDWGRQWGLRGALRAENINERESLGFEIQMPLHSSSTSSKMTMIPIAFSRPNLFDAVNENMKR